MGYPRIMGPGCAGGTSKMFNVNVNQITYGDKLQGLPPVTGTRRPYKVYKSKAGGNLPNRLRIYCINQLGGVGMVKNSQFAANADGIGPCPNRLNISYGFEGIYQSDLARSGWQPASQFGKHHAAVSRSLGAPSFDGFDTIFDTTFDTTLDTTIDTVTPNTNDQCYLFGINENNPRPWCSSVIPQQGISSNPGTHCRKIMDDLPGAGNTVCCPEGTTPYGSGSVCEWTCPADAGDVPSPWPTWPAGSNGAEKPDKCPGEQGGNGKGQCTLFGNLKGRVPCPTVEYKDGAFTGESVPVPSQDQCRSIMTSFPGSGSTVCCPEGYEKFGTGSVCQKKSGPGPVKTYLSAAWSTLTDSWRLLCGNEAGEQAPCSIDQIIQQNSWALLAAYYGIPLVGAISTSLENQDAKSPLMKDRILYEEAIIQGIYKVLRKYIPSLITGKGKESDGNGGWKADNQYDMWLAQSRWIGGGKGCPSGAVCSCNLTCQTEADTFATRCGGYDQNYNWRCPGGVGAWCTTDDHCLFDHSVCQGGSSQTPGKCSDPGTSLAVKDEYAGKSAHCSTIPADVGLGPYIAGETPYPELCSKDTSSCNGSRGECKM